ncbi:NAD(P)/FAD-dependent oxidoreductase [Marivirga arenosa]|uniref:NADH:ubiquinone reductase (non-electrogenic) n=1 Tax=Marivirga arenosa TaxID=3059076 RepID=A0AA51N8E2_9BACT|nr:MULTISPECIES: NAD(P)/FAD-dependent oxidoreductase [unclassified Marivirga]WMN07968.1 NAD(P)/FAD-dependent oxidoreductase [Marivirga sp. ABR2-2]WNB17832.1 NAD(P)/FAD-dependent oxidoreductase [Marivirga sp. BKB1-2]
MNQSNAFRIPDTQQKRIVIIGGGFAGITLAKKFAGKDVQVVLLDRHNYHTFQPLLYQVATAGLEPDSIAGPLRKLLENHKNIFFRMATVTNINNSNNKIKSNVGELSYDYLIIAAGSKTNFFGQQEKFEKAFPLKQIPQALDFRSHILQNFEEAVLSSDENDIERLMNIVIVGGGPTGVELAGALGELKKHVLPNDYPDLDFQKLNIYLVEGMDRLLGGMSEFADVKAQKYLKKFDVNVKLKTMVKSFDGENVEFDNGEKIPTTTLLWGAGVMGNIIEGLAEESVKNSRYKVDKYNLIEGTENIYAVGDIALMETEDFPKGHPMLAPVAMQQADLLAKNILASLKGKKQKAFKYLDKGSMATVGRNKAVVDLPKNLHFGGFMAWFIWMFVHLISIVGFRNKIVILSNWVWNYFTYDRGTRLIIRPFIPKINKQKKT